MNREINRETAKVSALSSGKIDKNEYLTGEELSPSDQGRITEQPKFKFLHSVKYLKNR